MRNPQLKASQPYYTYVFGQNTESQITCSVRKGCQDYILRKVGGFFTLSQILTFKRQFVLFWGRGKMIAKRISKLRSKQLKLRFKNMQNSTNLYIKYKEIKIYPAIKKKKSFCPPPPKKGYFEKPLSDPICLDFKILLILKK